jgi:hypothetical protein
MNSRSVSPAGRRSAPPATRTVREARCNKWLAGAVGQVETPGIDDVLRDEEILLGFSVPLSELFRD